MIEPELAGEVDVADRRETRLHLAVAAFRSIETRLPQLRVTSNGLSAFIDPAGNVVASTRMGDRAVLAGEVPIEPPPPTLFVRWGDWVGRAAGAFLLLLVASGVGLLVYVIVLPPWSRAGRVDLEPVPA